MGKRESLYGKIHLFFLMILVYICSFCGTYTKIRTIQRRLAMPRWKDDTQIRETFHISSADHCLMDRPRQWPGRPGFNPKSNHIKSSKNGTWCHLCLKLSIIRLGSRVKWSNLGKEVAPSCTPQCSSLWKRSVRVALDFDRQLYFSYMCGGGENNGF